ncbi:MAG: ComF family protein [Candidatus Kerfeldbacteria bacterium]|nr:ComF family protein [Candidatus Kerfeldbacteria bacterium]
MFLRFLNFLRDLLFPPLCIRCGKEGMWLCRNCLPRLPQHLHGGVVWSLLTYHEPWVGKAIHDMKYSGVADLAEIFGTLIADRWRVTPGVPGVDGAVVTAIPLHRRRERERGFNQAEQIARTFASSMNLPYVRLLERARKTSVQAQLDREARAVNVQKAFRPKTRIDRNAKLVFPLKTVILVDDVATTGATLNAAEQALKEASALNVIKLTVAYAPLKMGNTDLGTGGGVGS